VMVRNPRARFESAPVVLVVDDNLDYLSVLTPYLDFCGYKVVTAADGSSALRLARSGLSIQVALIDLALRDMNGYALANQLREYPQLRDVPFIAISGFAPRQIPQSEFVTHLIKPIEPQLLDDVIAMLCMTKSIRPDA
jgi:CheY-like chemotaxis protein